MCLAARGMYSNRRVIALVLMAAAVMFGSALVARAIEPTELEPAESAVAGQFQLELKGGYEDFDDGHETTLEAELSYGINDYVRLGLNVPYEWESIDDRHGDDDSDSGIGDVGAFLEWCANPESDGIVVGGEFKLTAPTADDSEGVGGEVQLRFSKAFAEKHGLHLTLKGYYESVEEDDHHHLFDKDDNDEEFGYMAVLGYTFRPVESTALIVDIAAGEAPEEGENTNLIELGLTHEFNDTVEVGLGVGAGLDNDSPDFVAHAGLELKFGGKSK